MTSSEAAAYLGVSVRRVQILADRIGAVKVGRDLLYPDAAVKAFGKLKRTSGNKSGKPRHRMGRPRKDAEGERS